MGWNAEQTKHIATVVHGVAVAQWVAFGLVAFSGDHYLAVVMYGVYFLALECIALAVLQYPEVRAKRVVVLINSGLGLGALAICITLALYAGSPAYVTIAAIQSFLLASALGAAFTISKAGKKVALPTLDLLDDPTSRQDAGEQTTKKFEEDLEDQEDMQDANLQRVVSDLREIAARREEIAKEATQLREDENRLRLEAAVNSVYAGLPEAMKPMKPLRIKRLFQGSGSGKASDKNQS
jgi:hypothetical protein